MPGDFSRKTFDKKKHYSGVLMQQGRVQLDADWNEEVDIEQYRTFTETKDVIGAAGVPKKSDGFRISVSPDGTDLMIAPGRIYVEGLLCELESYPAATYKTQPYYPAPDLSHFTAPASPASSPPGAGIKDGSYVVYLQAWQREISYLDDPDIQEKALGEADTTTRLQTVWQVKLLKVQDNGTGKCNTPFPEWEALTTPLSGKLNAQTKEPEDNKNPCVLPPSAGYLRLENQLYRVQVQKVDNAKKAQTFKWSRDNASIETTMEVVSGTVIRVADLGKDDVLGFADNQWLEIVDDVSTLGGNPNPLVQIDSIDPDLREITLKTPGIQFQPKNPKLRRWDMGTSATPDGLPVAAGWQDIEDGIQVMFSSGTFEPGDYWLIPARTATGNIEWPRTGNPLLPVAQSRIGTHYFYCRLAFAKVLNGAVTLEDCRDLFPSLTDICAEDICFDNNNCKFPAAQNVQQALDMLCAANDLRDHNKHLHGYGVVCGLKVICGPDRRQVTVETGYALDCEGNIIRNRSTINFDVMAAVANTGVLNDAGNGVACLTIAYNGANAPVINLEPFIRQSFWDEILEGTLLKDFLDGCIRSLIQAIQSELLPVKQEAPVPLSQRRLTALVNLLWQLINPQSGQYAFISGHSRKKRDPAHCLTGNVADKDEDELLYCFYEKLKSLLASETYCGQFDHQPFPAYTLGPGLSTVFGTPFKTHRRLRLDASGNFAYTCQGDSQINVYDLQTQEFVRWLDFPTPNVLVQDVCVSKDGSQLYVTGILNNKDSVFAIASLTNPGTWQGPFVVADHKFVTLAMHHQTERLFGVAKAKGLFEIKLSAEGVQIPPLRDFNATGLLVVADDAGLAYAAADSGTALGTESSTFTLIISFDFFSGAESSFDFKGNDSDNDLLYHNHSAYVTGDDLANTGSNMRILGKHSPNSGMQTVNLEETDSVVRLALVRQNADINSILVSFSDQSKVLRVGAIGDRLVLDDEFRIPVQVFPMAMAISNKEENTGYVLNTFVNTLTAIDIDRVLRAAPQPDFTLNPPEVIADYRDAAIAAYRGLFINLLQYLKDCFCDKFLIDCPQCGEDDKVYLGTIDIRNSQIHHICNYSKRKYVKTFPTVEYWLSTIPVLPLFKKAFTVFCCTVLDDLKRNRE
jgi:hypothetical protein